MSDIARTPVTQPQPPNGFGLIVVFTPSGISIGAVGHLSWDGLLILVGLTWSVSVALKWLTSIVAW